MSDLARKLKAGWPDAKWTLDGEAYAGLTWLGPGSKPSQSAVNAVVAPPYFPLLKRWQFKAMVNFLGVGDAIVAAISAIEDPMQRSMAMARFQESDVYLRTDPLFDQLAPTVGLTSQQIDDAWLTIAGQTVS